MKKPLLPVAWVWMVLAAGCLVLRAADGPPGRAAAATPATADQERKLQKSLPLPGEVFAVEGCTAFVILPAAGNHAANRPTPWVWYAPTLPALPEARERWMFDRFLAAGIAVAAWTSANPAAIRRDAPTSPPSIRSWWNGAGSAASRACCPAAAAA